MAKSKADPYLLKLRRQAATSQGGCCYYCKKQMWERDCKRFARHHGIPRKLAKDRRCTAEHLVARCDGGGDTPENIVAACYG